MLTRIITGVIGIIAAVGIITKGGMLFNAAVAVLAAVAWYEYHKMVENKGYHAYTLTGGVGALLMVLVAASVRGARFAWKYGLAHASPNSGYPEAALAGILDVRFGGPHTYDGELVEKPWIGENARAIASCEVERVVRINHSVCASMVALAGVLHGLLATGMLPWSFFP